MPRKTRRPVIEENCLRGLYVSVGLALCSTVALVPQLFNAFVTTKALWFCAFVMLALPFYVYLLFIDPALRPNLKNPLTSAVLAFLLFNSLASGFGVNPIRSFWGRYERMDGLYHLVHLTLLYLYVLLLWTARPIYVRRLIHLLLALAVLSGVYGISESFGVQLWLGDSVSGRASGLFGNPIFFASFLVLPIAFALFYSISAKSTMLRCFYIGAAVVLLYAVFLSGTRGAGVAVVVSIILAGILLIVKYHNTLRYATVSVLVCFSFLLGVSVLDGQRMPGPMSRLLVAVADASQAHVPDRWRVMLAPTRWMTINSGKERLLAWRVAWRGFREGPIFGTGPGNYDVLSNRYFDRRLYRYDYVTYDKPHNYPLELLATTGVGGLVCYIAMLGFTAIGFLKARRSGLLSFAECIVCLAGGVAYGLQNVFAFETPAASVAFYVYTAFGGCLWIGAARRPRRQKSDAEPAAPTLTRRLVMTVVVAISCIATVDAGMSAIALRDIKYGDLIGTRDAVLAKHYFENAVRSPFVHDPVLMGIKYEQFTEKVAEVDPELAKDAVEQAVGVLEKTSKQNSSDAAMWLKLSSLYTIRDFLNKRAAEPIIEVTIRKAMFLEPDRVEPLYYLARYEASRKQYDKAATMLEQIVREFPNDAQALWELALIYRAAHKIDLAVQTADAALASGYHITLLNELGWLVNYDLDHGNYHKVAELYKQAIYLSPNNYGLYGALAATYAKLGDKEHAIEAANRVLELKPSEEANIRQFVRSLQ